MENTINQVKEVNSVVNKSEYVKINYDVIDRTLSLFKKSESSNSIVLEYLNLEELTEEQIARFFLILQSIDFCFWGNPKWKISYQEKEFNGFYGLTISLIRAIKEGYNILDFDYLKQISKQDFEYIMRGTTKIHLFEERLKIIRNVAAISLDTLNGKVYDYFKSAKSDIELLDMIINVFPDFRDISTYEGNKVCFLKKATLLVYDLYCYLPKIRKNIKNTDNLLAGADYKLPQVLRELKILEYNQELEDLIDNNIIIEHNSKMEIEIRANTIYVIDLIKNKLQKMNTNMTSFEVGTAIWLLSKKTLYQNKPYHLCQTIFY